MDGSGNRGLSLAIPTGDCSHQEPLNHDRAGHGRPAERQGILLGDTDVIVDLPLSRHSRGFACTDSQRNRSRFLNERLADPWFASPPLPGSWRVPPHVTNFFYMWNKAVSGISTAGRTDLAYYSRVLRCDLFGNLSPVNFHIAWEIQCQTDAIALH